MSLSTYNDNKTYVNRDFNSTELLVYSDHCIYIKAIQSLVNHKTKSK